MAVETSDPGTSLPLFYQHQSPTVIVCSRSMWLNPERYQHHCRRYENSLELAVELVRNLIHGL